MSQIFYRCFAIADRVHHLCEPYDGFFVCAICRKGTIGLHDEECPKCHVPAVVEPAAATDCLRPLSLFPLS